MEGIYGASEPNQFGRMLAGIHCNSYKQARLLKFVLEDAMKNYAGRKEETLLAFWHKSVVMHMKKSQEENWVGWEDTYPIDKY